MYEFVHFHWLKTLSSATRSKSRKTRLNPFAKKSVEVATTKNKQMEDKIKQTLFIVKRYMYTTSYS